MDKKKILKKYTGKGGTLLSMLGSDSGPSMGSTVKPNSPFKIVRDTVVKGGGGLAKDIVKGVGNGISAGASAIKNKIMKDKVQSYVKPIAKPIPGRTPGEQGFEIIRPKQSTPKGWDSVTYRNFKKANPTLEPDSEDTYRMQNAK